MNQIYQITKNKLFVKDFGLKDQIQRASVSVMATIAEGYETFSDNEFMRFLEYSLRSCSEVKSHLYVALDNQYIAEIEFTTISELVTECSKLIRGLLKYLRNKK